MDLDLRPEQQPVVLRATCAPPRHTCHAVANRAFRTAVPVLITHRNGAGLSTVKCIVTRPWEVTPEARRALLAVFETYAAVLDGGARAVVERSLVEFRVPDPITDSFVADVAAALSFERGA